MPGGNAAGIDNLLQYTGYIEKALCQPGLIKYRILRNLCVRDGIDSLCQLAKMYLSKLAQGIDPIFVSEMGSIPCASLLRYILARCMVSNSVMVDLLCSAEVKGV